MPTFPAILELANATVHPLGADVVVFGRNESADVCLRDPSCSRQHFRLVRQTDAWTVEPMNAANPTLRNGHAAAAGERLEHGDLLQAGQVRFRFLLREERSEAAPDAALHDGATFKLSPTTIVGRDRAAAQICLPHPHVSRVHARIVMNAGSAIMEDLGSANGTFINGEAIRQATPLRSGDQIDIGPYELVFTGTAFVPQPRMDNVELAARDVRRTVRDRRTGRPLTLLDDVTLVIRPREFVCLLGPSGSGKSTLLALLSGRTNPDGGTVLVNGRNLHANFEALKQDIAVVPQRDVLHEALAVEDALRFTAKLRLPPDTSPQEIESSIGEMLDTVGLAPRRGTLIRHLSGGQAKRASLANEILCKPTLLFLDEVTSGLDEQTDREAMRLFRRLADGGKTVACVTHSLANVEQTCHLVVVLAPGGKLAFVGTPQEAIDYFRIDRLGDVYERLAEQPAEAWQQAFLDSPLRQKYVLDRLPRDAALGSRSVPRKPLPFADRFRAFFRQSIILTRRYAAIWRSDAASLLATFGQSLLVALLLGMLFGNLEAVANPIEHSHRSVHLVFLLAVSCFWFGCNNSAKEIVKERTIYDRERDFNLRPDSYYASKLAVLLLIGALQSALLFAIVRAWCGPTGPVLPMLSVLVLLAAAGTTLGLALSACAASEEMAIAMIPMAVIPQIILSGVIAPLEGASNALAWIFVSTFWGKRGLDACLPADVAAALRPTPLQQHSTSAAVLVLLGHCAAAAALALLALRVRRKA